MINFLMEIGKFNKKNNFNNLQLQMMMQIKILKISKLLLVNKKF